MNSNPPILPPDLAHAVQLNVAHALAEDIGTGDLTAALIDAERQTQASVLTRESAVVCGGPWVDAVVHQLAPEARVIWLAHEGQQVNANEFVLKIEGRAQALLSAERTLLNFLQMMSAVATKTARYVKAVQGTSAQIVDTRKTLPGLRLAQKYAVLVGGGTNHRIGLFDAILIKENHISAAGGIANVMQRVGAHASRAAFVEIEVETLSQLEEALAAGAKMILLDNMDLPTVANAVRINAGRAILEISGGVTLTSVRALAETGVDRISVGALTKDVTAIDFSMRFKDL